MDVIKLVKGQTVSILGLCLGEDLRMSSRVPRLLHMLEEGLAVIHSSRSRSMEIWLLGDYHYAEWGIGFLCRKKEEFIGASCRSVDVHRGFINRVEGLWPGIGKVEIGVNVEIRGDMPIPWRLSKARECR